MHSLSLLRGATVAFWMVIAALAFPLDRANAVVDCTYGITNPSSPLTDDYISHSGIGPCITLTNDADLDLAGHTITDDGSAGGFTEAAIKCTAPTSQVTNTGANAHNSLISGLFGVGVLDCQVVDGINIGTYPIGAEDVAPLIGIENVTYAATSIVNNRMIAADCVNHGSCVLGGIKSKLLDSSSRISNNYIEAEQTGIEVTGSTDASGPLVENNILSGVRTYSIIKTGTEKIRIRKNLVINHDMSGGGTTCFDITATGTTLGSNVCDCPSDCPIYPAYLLPWF